MPREQEPGRSEHAHAPVDPDVDLHDPGQRRELHRHHPVVLGVIAIGGVLGAEARYVVGLLLPHDSGAWPWSTLAINLTGSLALGLLMGWLGRRAHPHPLIRPFAGVGILGGYTTFSTYALDADRLMQAGRVAVALLYLATTLIAGLGCVAMGFTLARGRRA